MAASMSANTWAQGTRVDIVSGMTRTQATQVLTMASKKVIPVTEAGLISVIKGLQLELVFSLVTSARYSKISLQKNAFQFQTGQKWHRDVVTILSTSHKLFNVACKNATVFMLLYAAQSASPHIQ